MRLGLEKTVDNRDGYAPQRVVSLERQFPPREEVRWENAPSLSLAPCAPEPGNANGARLCEPQQPGKWHARCGSQSRAPPTRGSWGGSMRATAKRQPAAGQKRLETPTKFHGPTPPAASAPESRSAWSARARPRPTPPARSLCVFSRRAGRRPPHRGGLNEGTLPMRPNEFSIGARPFPRGRARLSAKP